MEKYFSSTYNSGIGGSKTFSSFNSMIAISPKQNNKELLNTYKGYQKGALIQKTLLLKKS